MCLSCVVHYYKSDRDFFRLPAFFIITKCYLNSSDCLRCSLLQRGSPIHQNVCVVHYYKCERDFISLSALFTNKKGTRLHQIALVIITNWNVTSSDCLRSSTLRKGT